jgi:4'-phosphopantetheinyl transferase
MKAAPDVVRRRVSQARDLPALRDLLSPDERAEEARYLRAGDRDRFALGRATLRQCAGRALGLAPQRVALARDAMGKPGLMDAPDLACNVSHSGDCVAVAFGRAPEIGVDVEAHRAGLDLNALAAAFMTARERAAMERAASQEAFFYRQWCFKEALVKALGTGLALEPRRFEILFEGDAARVHFVGPGPDDVGGGWRLCALDMGEGYSGALAWR